ncbi:MAG: response regulator [Planctomycetes bacterium]|nr:response regulator [Planctomycetota bacterium]
MVSLAGKTTRGVEGPFSRVPAELGSARDLDEAVQVLLEYVASRWPCRAQVLAVPGVSPSQAPRLSFRGLTGAGLFQLGDPISAWVTCSLRFPGSREACFAWFPIPGAPDTSAGFLTLLSNETRPLSDEDRQALAGLVDLAGPVLCQLRRGQAVRRLLDQQARERQARELELSCQGRILNYLTLGPLEAVFPDIARELRQLLFFDRAGILVPDGDEECFRELAAADAAGAARELLRPQRGAGLLFTSVLSQPSAVRWDDLGSGAEPPDLVVLRELGQRSALLLPLQGHGSVAGLLVLTARQPYQFRPQDAQCLAPILAHLGGTLANARAIEDLEGLRHSWEETFDVFPDGVLLLDDKDRVLRLNRAAQELLGTRTSDTPGVGLADRLAAASQAVRDGARLRLAEREFEVARFQTPGRHGPSSVVILREARGPQSTPEDLAQGEKLSLLGQLMAGIAHELNNPLAAVIGFASILRHQVKDELIRRRLLTLDEAANRCREIVQGLLGFARKHAPERKRISLKDVVERTVALLKYHLTVSNVAVEIDFPEGCPEIDADEYQLQQVFLNLLVNAFQAIADHSGSGHIWVRAAAGERAMTVRVEDDGPGLSPIVRARLFEPFLTTKPPGKGTGLGLTISRQIVGDHGGRLEAGDRQGGGTVFSLVLPLPDATASLRPSDVLPAPVTLPGTRVLVVDDETPVRDLVCALLDQAGARPVQAASGHLAIAALQAGEFDAVISDVRMPELDGRGLYQWVLANRPALAARILFTTGDTVSEVSATFLRESGVRWVAKPFASAALLQAVSEVLRPAQATA